MGTDGTGAEGTGADGANTGGDTPMKRTVTRSDSYSIFRFWQTEKRNEKEPVEAAMPPNWLSWWI